MNKLAVGKGAEPVRGGSVSYPGPAMPGEASANPLADALQVLLRRRVFIVCFITVITALSALVILSLPKVYMARTEVALLINQANIVDLEAVVTGVGKDDDSIQTEIRILRSRRLASKLMDDLMDKGLTDFTVRAPETSFVRRTARSILGGTVGWVAGLAGTDEEAGAEVQQRDGALEAGAGTAAEDAAGGETDFASIANDLRNSGLPGDVESTLADDGALTDFTKMFDVYRLGSSRVIAIEVRAYHPEIAVILADGLAETYIEDQLDARFEATTRASNWLSQRIAALRTRVDASEREVVAFMAKTGISESQTGQIWLREIGETNQQLSIAQRNLSDVQQRLAIARADPTGPEVDILAQELEASAAAGSSAESMESLPEVISSRAIQQLRLDQSRLQRTASDLRQSLGARHPRVAQVLAELSDVNAEINREIQRTVQALEVQQQVASAEVTRLEQRQAELEAELSEAQQAQVTLRALQREADADRLMLENFLTRFRETREQSEQELQAPDARIISYAGLPQHAAAPPTKFLLAASLMASLGLAVALAYGLESLETGYRLTSQLERRTGLPVLSQIPRATDKLGRDGKNLLEHLQKNPRSSFAESVRQLYITLKLEDMTGGSSVMITSSQSAEGKSTLAAAMAVVAAQAGQKVVLVEADLRRPRLARLMKREAKSGLANFLAGTNPIEDIIATTSQHNVHIIPAGRVSKQTVETFDSRAMAALMRALQDEFDLVVVDAPPVLAVADALNVSALVRSVVYVVQWGGTQREMVDIGLRRLSLAGAYVAGIAMTMVRTNKNAMFNYGDHGVYVGDRISRYYDDQ